MARNQHHAWHSLQTPFAANQILADHTNPNNPDNRIQQLVQGTYLDNTNLTELSKIETQWIQELERKSNNRY
jgi:hypothetical protein